MISPEKGDIKFWIRRLDSSGLYKPSGCYNHWLNSSTVFYKMAWKQQGKVGFIFLKGHKARPIWWERVIFDHPTYRSMKLIAFGPWTSLNWLLLIPVKDHVDPPVICSHPEHSFCESIAILAKGCNVSWLSKCHHKCLAINEQTTRLNNFDICRHFYLLCQDACHHRLFCGM